MRESTIIRRDAWHAARSQLLESAPRTRTRTVPQDDDVFSMLVNNHRITCGVSSSLSWEGVDEQMGAEIQAKPI